MHRAKGLEFDEVILLEISGVTPGGATPDDVNRLQYVALTRAKKRLCLTWAAERGTGTMKSSRLPSRFLSELPGDGVSRGAVDKSMEERSRDRKEKTISVLQNLRAGLKPSPGKHL